MAPAIDFKDLASYSLRYIADLVPEWLPGGRMVGNEWVCGSKNGGPGDSMRVNMSTGLWADFATDEKGGDLISLYACINSVKQKESALYIKDRLNYRVNTIPSHVPSPKPPPTKPTDKLIKPPTGLNPTLKHFKLGDPSMSWAYRDTDGLPLFWIARYDVQGKGKEFFPWSYSEQQKKLIMKGWPEPRPIFNLDKLFGHPNKPVMIVEGEKCVIGAERIGAEANYVVTTWPNGSKSFKKANWSVLKGRNILIWPDADEPGMQAGTAIANILSPFCNQIKIIRPERLDGWDAWDAYTEGKSWAEIIDWAKRRVIIHKKQIAPPKPIPEPEPQEAMEAEIVEEPPETPTVKADININTEPPATNKEAEQILSLDQYGVALNGRGKPYMSISNISRIFDGPEIFKGHFWYDEFDYRNYTDMFGKPHEISDADILKITSILQRKFGIPTVMPNTVADGLSLIAHNYPRHSVCDWIKTLKWDGTPRIVNFFPNYLGAEKNEYTEAVSRNFWVGMVARVFNPGCKNDHMVVLEGPQGVGKSMALSSIGGQWHTESAEAFGSKDFFQGLHGKMIVEIAELDSFSRAEVTRVKQVVTAQRDRFRASYGRTASDYPRQCIFVGTTNESGYLRDATGARRFWPIRCSNIRIDQINSDREQLFAEAYVELEKGTKWYMIPHEKAQEEQEERYQHDEIEVKVLNYLKGKTHILMVDLAKDALNTDESKLDRRIQMRIGTILRRRGWSPRREYVDGEQVRVWAPKGVKSFADQELLSGNGSDIGF